MIRRSRVGVRLGHCEVGLEVVHHLPGVGDQLRVGRRVNIDLADPDAAVLGKVGSQTDPGALVMGGEVSLVLVEGWW